MFQRNNTFEECKRLSQQELVSELKQKGTYNPDLMAWDASGVIRFLDRSIVDQYEVSIYCSAQNCIQPVSSQRMILRKILMQESNLHAFKMLIWTREIIDSLKSAKLH